MNKILWFDTETTGLSPVVNGIVQLSGLIDIDSIIVDEFDYKINVFDSDVIEQSALDVHGFTKEQISKFDAPYKAHCLFTNLLSKHCSKFDKEDKFFPAGYNCKFDIDFLAQWFLKCNDVYLGSWLNWRWIDPLALINILCLNGVLKLENHKLETVCKYLGIELKAHDAISDIKATREVYHKAIKLLKK